MTQQYPKRLIEVDLPIKRISAHARQKKYIRHGAYLAYMVWWARRPLAACRAVICASLWPDPVSLSDWVETHRSDVLGKASKELAFLNAAAQQMKCWANAFIKKASVDTQPRLMALLKDATIVDNPETLRALLLDFVADFAKWENSVDQDYLTAARALTEAAYQSLGGEGGGHPLVVDLFAGGGVIPLEALRVGAEAFATDLNPLAVLLTRLSWSTCQDLAIGLSRR